MRSKSSLRWALFLSISFVLIFKLEKGKIDWIFHCKLHKTQWVQRFFKECIMQDTALSRWLAPVMAFCLSFVMITTLAPTVGIQIDRQFDFWLLWLGVGWGYVVWFSGLFTDCCSGLASCFVVWGWLGFCWFCLESLILAQDERWRRA